MNSEFINVQEAGIKGINYYWLNCGKFGITHDELRAVGVEGNFAYIHKDLLPVLLNINKELAQKGYELIVKDGYRSPEQYKLVQEKRYLRDGKENTDKTLNTVTMPHASGYVLDVNLVNTETGNEEKLRNTDNWPDGSFVDYYRDKQDPASKKYQELQDLLVSTMLKHGFELGSKKEFWHFEYTKKP